jgi:uncharacterized protein
MKELVEYLVKSLVDSPQEVLIAEEEESGAVLMQLKVADEDLGKIIGKNGNTINAIRTVVQAAASSRKMRVKLDVLS